MTECSISPEKHFLLVEWIIFIWRQVFDIPAVRYSFVLNFQKLPKLKWLFAVIIIWWIQCLGIVFAYFMHFFTHCKVSSECIKRIRILIRKKEYMYGSRDTQFKANITLFNPLSYYFQYRAVLRGIIAFFSFSFLMQSWRVW